MKTLFEVITNSIWEGLKSSISLIGTDVQNWAQEKGITLQDYLREVSEED